jgi:peptidoglycan biosynthesis protein MviN/MurJ (putative lipid II flippase)
MNLAIFYTIFAAISTVVNIGGQEIVVRLYHGAYAVTLSILVGTAVGLLVKYVLDKRYIFRFKTQSATHDVRTFFLYALMGITTTVIFWGFEYTFEFLFKTKELRYLGGVIGLAIGYVTKYQLDKRFVFINLASNPLS